DQGEASPSLERGADHIVGKVVAATSLLQKGGFGRRQPCGSRHWRRGGLFLFLLLFRFLFLLNSSGEGSDQQHEQSDLYGTAHNCLQNPCSKCNKVAAGNEDWRGSGFWLLACIC